MGRGVWQTRIHGITKSQTQLNYCAQTHTLLQPDTETLVSLESENVSHTAMSDSLQPLWSHQGSSLHGILQARILELVAIPFSRGSS